MMKKLWHVPVIVIALAACIWGHARKPAAPQFGYGPGKGVNCVAFSADGRTIVAAGFDKPAVLTITLWNIATGKSRRTFSSNAPVLYDGYAFSPDARTLVAGGSLNTDFEHFTVTLWDVATGKTLHAMTGHTKQTDDNEFSPDGRTLASGSQDQSIMLWDVATGRLVRTMYDNVGMVFAVSFSPDGHTLASASSNYQLINDRNPADAISTIDLWDVATGEIVRTLPKDVSDVVFSPDGHTLTSTNSDNTVALWDVSTWQVIRPFADEGYPVVFSPDGRTVASQSDNNAIHLIDVATGKVLQTLTGHTDFVTSIAFSRDGHTLASGSNDNTIKLWDVTTGKLLNTFGVPNPPSDNTGSAGTTN
jgi:WD40 repeat protein